MTAAMQAHYLEPHNMRALPDADAIGRSGIEGQGPHMTVYLRLQGERIAEAAFTTYGCPVAIACGSWLTRWATGRTIEQVETIEPGDLETVLGGLPLGKEYCAQMAVTAVRQAVRGA